MNRNLYKLVNKQAASKLNPVQPKKCPAREVHDPHEWSRPGAAWKPYACPGRRYRRHLPTVAERSAEGSRAGSEA